ncbi:uncharacterized protein cp110 isoform X2 [Antennarius striatus]|uniref:uncharacterized protein cp110 isoform X2 n=1 Tax=Antennarius striatus TaxID=241820 RepID=UPI0035AECDF7
MEDYDKFVQHRLSSVRKTEEKHDRPSPRPSVIRFYGQPILPPQLSEEQKEEMQRHRDAAQKAAVHRAMMADGRMAYLRTILQSVQLRKTLTLEELLQESETYTTSLNSHDAREDRLLSLLPQRKENIFFPPAFTSATCSAFITSDVTPQPNDLEQCLTDSHYRQRGSQPNLLNSANHQLESSGYMTHEKVENTTSVSEEKNAQGASHGFDSSEGVSNISTFLHNSLNTIAKTHDIIIYPPIDGEELERSGQELSYCTDFIVAEDTSCSLIQEVSMKCDHSQGEKCKSSRVDSTKGGDNFSLNTVCNLDKDHSLDIIETHISPSESSGFFSKPESQWMQSTPHCPARQWHIEPNPPETESTDNRIDEIEPEPCRLSLQALLKKSQEYRRRQRMLRNQAKNSKIHETTQEQARSRTEERSQSDKENDECPNKGTVTSEERRSKESRETFVQISPKQSWINGNMIERRTDLKSDSTHLTGNGTDVGVESTLKNNQLNISQEVVAELKRISDFPQQWNGFTQTLHKDFCLPTYSAAFHTGGRKDKAILVPLFCRSPVDWKRKGSNQDVQTDATEASATSSEHIDQIESNLSSLKILICDLESTRTEGVGIHSQRRLSTDSSFQSVKHIQGDSVYSEDKMSVRANDSDVDEDQRSRDGQGRQSDIFIQILDEETGPQSSITENVPLTAQFKGAEAVDFNQLRGVKLLAKRNAACKEISAESNEQHNGGRKQQLLAKRILSVAQWHQVPEGIRNIPSEETTPCQTSVPLDTSNHQWERRSETAVGHHLTVWETLNQSYDVDTPSGLWSLEETSPDLALGCHRVPEKHLTPESEGEGQGGESKVKRRLLMQGIEDTADASRGGDDAAGPNSTIPSGAMWCQEGRGYQRDKQEELKRVQADQIRVLQDQHRRQEEELLKALAARYRVLQSASFPSCVSGSHLGDTLSFPTLSQRSNPRTERCRPLLAAVVKGFLTRRLMKTEKVAQLVRTIRDTQQFLQTFQQQSPERGESCSRQDLLLKKRAVIQLRAARYELSDIFFSLTARRRMQLISRDRQALRERECMKKDPETCS